MKSMVEQWKFHFCNCCIIVLWPGRHRPGALLLRVKLHLLHNTSLHDFIICFLVFLLFRRINLLPVGVTERGKTEIFFLKKNFRGTCRPCRKFTAQRHVPSVRHHCTQLSCFPISPRRGYVVFITSCVSHPSASRTYVVSHELYDISSQIGS